jgi:catechol 2,3-dioxygenase-like lactoylglutathione lyase family enzyme
MIRLEHANLSVQNTEAMRGFLEAAFPEFRVRGGGLDDQGRAWCHVGNDEFYIALQTVPTRTDRQPYGNQTGLNHLGWETDDIRALQARMEQAGFEANLAIDDHPARKRRYFHDPDGNDWEFVQYLSAHQSERNDYGA